MKNVILIVLDSARGDLFEKQMKHAPQELKKDFVKFTNCRSIYSTTFLSHYAMFFGDNFNKRKQPCFDVGE